MRRQRTRRSPRGVRFEPEVSAVTSRSRPDTSAGATDTRGGGRLTPRPALSRRPCRLNFVIALLPALNVRVPTSHPVPQAKPGSIHPPWAWEASPTTVPMPATAPKRASTSRKVRDPESVNHPPPRSACAHPTRRCSRPSRLPVATPPRIAEILGYTGRRGTIDEADETTAGLRNARTRRNPPSPPTRPLPRRSSPKSPRQPKSHQTMRKFLADRSHPSASSGSYGFPNPRPRSSIPRRARTRGAVSVDEQITTAEAEIARLDGVIRDSNSMLETRAGRTWPRPGTARVRYRTRYALSWRRASRRRTGCTRSSLWTARYATR